MREPSHACERSTELRICGRNREHAQQLADELRSEMPCDVVPVEGFDVACAGAQVICATTHSPDPVVSRSTLDPGAHVNSVGYNTAGREIDSRTVADALLVVESRAAVLAPPPSGSTDIRMPIEEGLITEAHVHAELGELVAGIRHGRTSSDQLTLYKSVGVAAQDVAAAALVLRSARAHGVGVHVDL